MEISLFRIEDTFEIEKPICSYISIYSHKLKRQIGYLDCPSIPSIHLAFLQGVLHCNGCITFGIGNIDY